MIPFAYSNQHAGSVIFRPRIKRDLGPCNARGQLCTARSQGDAHDLYYYKSGTRDRCYGARQWLPNRAQRADRLQRPA